MRRFFGRTTVGLAGAALTLSMAAGCSDDGSSDPEPTEAPSSSESPSASPSESPSESPSGSPTQSPSQSPSGSPSESEEPSASQPSTTVERPSRHDRTPDGLDEAVSAVELGRLSVGGPDRLSGEKFAVAVAQAVVDVRAPRDQGAVLHDLASPRLSQEAREQVVADYDGQRGLQSNRHFMQDAEIWMRSGVKGKARAPREVAVEVVGVVDAGAGQLLLAAVRVDVVRRDGRWELVSVSGPDVRGPFGSVLETVEPRLEGRHWRQLPRTGSETPADEE